MNDLVAEGGRYGQHPSVYHGAGWSGCYRCNVTDGTSDRAEYLLACLGVCSSSDVEVARDRLSRPHKFGKAVDVVELGRVELVGHAHFVQVCIARKREKAGVLVFPAEAADSQRIVCLGYRDANRQSMDFPAALSGLVV